jgi:FkbM family methyltransferase
MSFYSQHGEDSYIKNLFPGKNNGVCIEIGAYDGISLSNTKHFEEIGWRALCIEPIESAFEKCKNVRKECYKCCISEKDSENKNFTIFHLNDNLCAISSLEPDQRLIESHKHMITNVTNESVKVRSLNSLLEELNFPKEIDFISVDTENTELDVLKGIDLNVYNVKLFVVENNFDEPFCENYLSQYGYKKIHRLAVNDFYLKTTKYEQYHGEIQQGKYVDEILASYFPAGYKGTFFDIGAYEAINISNSYHFEMNGWKTYCFEANTLLISDLKSKRTNVFNYAVSNENKDFCEFNVVKGVWGGGSLMAGLSAIDLDADYMNRFSDGIKEIIKIKVPQKTLNNVIETEISDLIEIDIMSIDVEGGELNVLKGLDLNKYKPKILVIENVFNKSDIYDYLKNYSYILDKHIDYNQYYKLNI